MREPIWDAISNTVFIKTNIFNNNNIIITTTIVIINNNSTSKLQQTCRQTKTGIVTRKIVDHYYHYEYTRLNK